MQSYELENGGLAMGPDRDNELNITTEDDDDIYLTEHDLKEMLKLFPDAD